MPDAEISDALIRRLLEETRTIALVGASPSPERPSYRVMAFLLAHGYRVLPVNPATAVARIHGMPVHPSLTEISEPVDMVDVFRRSPLVGPIAHEAVAIKARTLWLQLGVVNPEAEAIAQSAGLAVIMDRCPAIEIRRLNIPSKR